MSTLYNCLVLLLLSAFIVCEQVFKKNDTANEECCGSPKVSIVIEKLNIEVPENAMKNAKMGPYKIETVGRIEKDGDSKQKTAPVLSVVTSREEEETRNKYCSEIDNSTFKIVSRSEWRATNTSISEKRTKKADLLIVEGNTFKSKAEVHWMRDREEFEFSYFGAHLSNFYIADDGSIFEGLGWDNWNNVANGGLGERSLIVFFTALVEIQIPSEAALKAYEQLIKAAICRNILSPDYKLIPKYLVWDYRSGRKDFEDTVMVNWDRYTNNLDFIFGNENVDNGLFPIAVNEEWGSGIPPPDLFTITPPIENVVISNLGSRCFNYQGCVQEVRSLIRFLKMQNLLFLPNFVIGEDGRAYEVIGWDNANTGELGREKAILVLFAGEFNIYSPNPRAVTTFHRVMKLGIWLGKVASDYKIAFASGDNIPTGHGIKTVFEPFWRMMLYPFNL